MSTAEQILTLDVQNPWPGLAAYDETCSDFFHGRNTEIEELLRLVRLAPLTVLYGKSGLGKSSLLQAGLFPRLRQAHYLPVYIRLDVAHTAAHTVCGQAAQRLQEELVTYDVDFPAFAPGETLWRYLHRRELELWSQDNNLLTPVLVFDQFEELFTHGGLDGERVRRACHELADLIENRIPMKITSSDDGRRAAAGLDVFSQSYRVILSFREDFLPDIKNWERDVPSLLKNWHQLQPMNRAQAVAVTQAGAAVLAPGAADAIVDFVGNLEQNRTDGDHTVEPVLLSLCCYQLNMRRKQRQAALIDTDTVGKEGKDILETFYTEALDGMPDKVSHFIEDHLIQGNRYRGSYPEDQAIEDGFITQEQLAALTSRHRLLRIDRQRGTARIELIHDRLVGVVREARDRRLAIEQQRELNRQRELEQAQTIAIEQQRRAEEQAKSARRLLFLSVGLASMLVVLMGVILFAWHQKERRLAAIDAADKALGEADKIVQEFHDERAERVKEILGQAQSSLVRGIRGDKGDATNDSGGGRRIYIQMRPEQPREKVALIQQQLQKQQFDVPGIETLRVGPTTNTEVRYFQNTDEDEATATKIVSILADAGIKNVKSIYIPGHEDSIKIQSKHFEIWFAQEAFKEG